MNSQFDFFVAAHDPFCFTQYMNETVNPNSTLPSPARKEFSRGPAFELTRMFGSGQDMEESFDHSICPSRPSNFQGPAATFNVSHAKTQSATIQDKTRIFASGEQMDVSVFQNSSNYQKAETDVEEKTQYFPMGENMNVSEFLKSFAAANLTNVGNEADAENIPLEKDSMSFARAYKDQTKTRNWNDGTVDRTQFFKEGEDMVESDLEDTDGNRRNHEFVFLQSINQSNFNICKT